MKTEHLEKIIDYTKSKERVEKSKYFTEEFFEKYGIKKYKELIEKYEEIYFKSQDGTVYCKRNSDDKFVKEYSLYKFEFSDAIIEAGKEFLKELDEENRIARLHSRRYEECETPAHRTTGKERHCAPQQHRTAHTRAGYESDGELRCGILPQLEARLSPQRLRNAERRPLSLRERRTNHPR